MVLFVLAVEIFWITFQHDQKQYETIKEVENNEHVANEPRFPQVNPKAEEVGAKAHWQSKCVNDHEEQGEKDTVKIIRFFQEWYQDGTEEVSK